MPGRRWAPTRPWSRPACPSIWVCAPCTSTVSPAARALHCATTVAARLFGVDRDLGTVEPGKIADLTVVDGDPFTDFGCLVHTVLVLRDGVVHRREDLVRPRETTARPAPRCGTWLDVAEYLQQGSCCHPSD
ncbi:amidohydrolase family protein [Streptomyces sp. SudanB25_2051]|uniref:amidohydrolase family protein n=1 Tax=Streptomyces sp. SudanB25_2051 TaxID=3035275 RepID=UPI003F568CA2